VLGGLPGVTSFSLTAVDGQSGYHANRLQREPDGCERRRARSSSTAANAVEGKLQIKAAAPVTGFVGRLSADATFQRASVASAAARRSRSPSSKTDTEANRNILDVVATCSAR